METKNKYKFQFAQSTDVGCVRKLNEDTLYCGENLWLVADGMGGHACGEVASQLAAEVISKAFENAVSLDQAIDLAHKKVLETAESDKNKYGMGTTVVALTSDNKNYQVSWVGDSRAYLWDANNSTLEQISEDHSLMVRLIKSGLISKAEAKNHPQRHMITQCLGSTELEKVKVDSLYGSWKPKQQILLCSDGLSDDVSSDEIIEVLKLNESNQYKCEKLNDLAKSKGGKDNISMILVESPVLKTASFWSKLKSMFKN